MTLAGLWEHLHTALAIRGMAGHLGFQNGGQGDVGVGAQPNLITTTFHLPKASRQPWLVPLLLVSRCKDGTPLCAEGVPKQG